MHKAGAFADRAMEAVRRLGHPLCVGLDPHLGRIPQLFKQGDMAPGEARTVAAVEDFLTAVVERIAGQVAIVKPQIAFFEAMGWRGLEMLSRVSALARRRGLLMLLDAKRGDIGSTARAYAEAYFGEGAPMPCDALTLNPYLGMDSLEPFLQRATEQGCGVFVLVKTSNPGSGDFQDQPLQDGTSLFEDVAASLAEPAMSMQGDMGWSSLGVVVGATYPGESQRIRALLPKSLFLVPGYGAQGGSAAQAVQGFVAGADGRLEGGLVNSSRGILYPAAGDTADARGWERAFDAALRQSIDELSEAVAG